MRKVAARWVPCLLSDEDKKRRVGAALEFLLEYNEVGNEILGRIVTGDESLRVWSTFGLLSARRNQNNGRKKKNRHRKNANRFPAQER